MSSQLENVENVENENAGNKVNAGAKGLNALKAEVAGGEAGAVEAASSSAGAAGAALSAALAAAEEDEAGDESEEEEDGMIATSHDGRHGGKRKPGRRWTSMEDSVLRELVEKNGNRRWKRTAKEFGERSGSERSNVQCQHRWNKCLKPGLLKGPWTPDEDETIRRMIEENGGPQHVRWSVIAKVLNGRLGKQVRERWINNLDPAINKGEWSAEEDDKLYDLHKRLGNKWKCIAEHMPGRSENCVKNRFHSIKPVLIARREGLDAAAAALAALPPGSKKAASKQDMATIASKSAVAAAVAASLSGAMASKKRRAGAEEGEGGSSSSNSKRAKPSVNTKAGHGKRSPSRNSPRSQMQESLSQSSNSLARLLSIGQTLESGVRDLDGSMLTVATDFANQDMSTVAERAKQLLRMSESYREMAASLLHGPSSSSASPPSPVFNEMLQREIMGQLAKQMPSLMGMSGMGALSPVTDPVLFSTYYDLFSQLQPQLSTPGSGGISPTQLLAAAAAAQSKAEAESF
jgi:hypothetical protein